MPKVISRAAISSSADGASSPHSPPARARTFTRVLQLTPSASALVAAPETATQQAVLRTYFCLCGEFLVRVSSRPAAAPSQAG